MNLVLITSVINISNNPLSYTSTRSVYTREERYLDTKKTIESIKKYIPNNRILLVECSILSEEENKYLEENVDFYLNLCNKENIVKMTTSLSKSMGEGIMTIEAIKYMKEHNINYGNLFKISGRYWLNQNFNYELYNNNKICIHRIQNDYHNIATYLYKLPQIKVDEWYQFLSKSFEDFENCVGYEVIFGKFINSLIDDKIEIEKVGINGYISVSRDFLDV